MRGLLFVLGGVFLVVGVVWLGQGVGVIRGSFMTGATQWAIFGGVCMVLGAFLLRTGFRWHQARSVGDKG